MRKVELIDEYSFQQTMTKVNQWNWFVNLILSNASLKVSTKDVPFDDGVWWLNLILIGFDFSISGEKFWVFGTPKKLNSEMVQQPNWQVYFNPKLNPLTFVSCMSPTEETIEIISWESRLLFEALQPLSVSAIKLLLKIWQFCYF